MGSKFVVIVMMGMDLLVDVGIINSIIGISYHTTVVYVGGNTLDKLVNWVDVTHQAIILMGKMVIIRIQDLQLFYRDCSPNTNGINDVILLAMMAGFLKLSMAFKVGINLDGPGLYITEFYGIGGKTRILIG